jgi:hypothetical protein
MIRYPISVHEISPQTNSKSSRFPVRTTRRPYKPVRASQNPHAWAALLAKVRIFIVTGRLTAPAGRDFAARCLIEGNSGMPGAHWHRFADSLPPVLEGGILRINGEVPLLPRPARSARRCRR